MDILTLAMANNGGGGVTSWNDLTDKPFGEELVDEPIQYLVDDSYGELDVFGATFLWIYASELNDFDGITVQCEAKGGTHSTVVYAASGSLAYDMSVYGCHVYRYDVPTVNDDGDVYHYIGQLVVVPINNEAGLNAGVYYLQNTNAGVSHNATFKFIRINHIDEEYLPDTLVTVDQITAEIFDLGGVVTIDGNAVIHAIGKFGTEEFENWLGNTKIRFRYYFEHSSDYYYESVVEFAKIRNNTWLASAVGFDLSNGKPYMIYIVANSIATSLSFSAKYI